MVAAKSRGPLLRRWRVLVLVVVFVQVGLAPRADTFLEANDRIVSIASPAAQEALAKYLGPTSQIDKNGIRDTLYPILHHRVP